MIYLRKKIFTYILLIILGVSFVVVLFLYSNYIDQIGILVLAITLAVLTLYAYDTKRIANESVQQTELQTTPIMSLYVRYISGVKKEKERETIRKEYAILPVGDGGLKPTFYIALRNVGEGAAFNVSMESDNFKVKKYQTRFFAPKNDEHAVKIIKKPDNNPNFLEELNNEIFTIKCQSVIGKEYKYKFKIIDLKERTVEFKN